MRSIEELSAKVEASLISSECTAKEHWLRLSRRQIWRIPSARHIGPLYENKLQLSWNDTASEPLEEVENEERRFSPSLQASHMRSGLFSLQTLWSSAVLDAGKFIRAVKDASFAILYKR